MRLAPAERGLTPILSATLPDEKEPQVVAWAVERKNGGRGFGYTGGHFHSNWQDENVRRMVLNALVWTAHGEVPEGGVRSTLPKEEKPAEPAKNSGPSSDTELDYRPADPRLKAVLIDRSPDESFVSIKADTPGRLFVGGREALFVYRAGRQRRLPAAARAVPLPAGLLGRRHRGARRRPLRPDRQRPLPASPAAGRSATA